MVLILPPLCFLYYSLCLRTLLQLGADLLGEALVLGAARTGKVSSGGGGRRALRVGLPLMGELSYVLVVVTRWRERVVGGVSVEVSAQASDLKAGALIHVQIYTGSEERGVLGLGFGNSHVAILPSWQYMKNIAL